MTCVQNSFRLHAYLGSVDPLCETTALLLPLCSLGSLLWSSAVISGRLLEISRPLGKWGGDSLARFSSWSFPKLVLAVAYSVWSRPLLVLDALLSTLGPGALVLPSPSSVGFRDLLPSSLFHHPSSGSGVQLRLTFFVSLN